VKHAYERDSGKVREWLENTYPDIKRPAKEEKGDIEALGNQEGYTSKAVKALAAALTERIQQMEASGEKERKKNYSRR
jgi:hypothetical protein